MSNGASSCRSPPSSPGRSGPAPPSRPSGSARARPVTTVLRPVASTSCRTGAQKPSPSDASPARGARPARRPRRPPDGPGRAGRREVQQRGGHVGAVAREHVDRGDGRRLRVGDAAQPGELAQRAQPPLADHPAGGLGARAEHPVRARLRRTDGAQREGEPGLLRPAPAGQQHRQVLLEDRLARQRVGQRRLQARPHLGPGGREGRRQRLRVPGTEHRGVGVVVEQRPLADLRRRTSAAASAAAARRPCAARRASGAAAPGACRPTRPRACAAPSRCPRRTATPRLTSRVRAGARMSGAASAMQPGSPARGVSAGGRRGRRCSKVASAGSRRAARGARLRAAGSL